MTGGEHGSILGICTLRYLNDTLSTSPFGQKESLDILSRYVNTCVHVHRYLAYVIDVPYWFLHILLNGITEARKIIPESQESLMTKHAVISIVKIAHIPGQP